MSTQTSDVKVIQLASKFALADILENYNISNPVDIAGSILINEDDSNSMIDKLASAVKFKDLNGDQDNSFEEGSEDKEIKLDDNGGYIGKGKTTVYDRDIDLENNDNSKERWVETPTGKVSDGDTEQVPNAQETENFNESSNQVPNETTSISIIKSLLENEYHTNLNKNIRNSMVPTILTTTALGGALGGMADGLYNSNNESITGNSEEDSKLDGAAIGAGMLLPIGASFGVRQGELYTDDEIKRRQKDNFMANKIKTKFGKK